jgi:hypothetical protein
MHSISHLAIFHVLHVFLLFGLLVYLLYKQKHNRLGPYKATINSPN